MRIPALAPWTAHAACKGRTDLFFPERGDPAAELVAQAKAICAGCPVRIPCLEAGHHEEFGVWGGLTVDERRRLRRKREQRAA